MISHWLLVGLAALLPWAYGGTEAWAQGAAGGAVGLIAAIYLAEEHVKGRSPQALVADMLRTGWPPAAAGLLLYVTLQAINSSHVFSPLDQGLTPRFHLAWMPHGIDLRVSGLTALKLLAYSVALWIAADRLCNTPKRRRTALLALGIGGIAMACLVVVQPMTEEERELTGSFVNPNNYAAFANLLLPLLLQAGRNYQTGFHVVSRRSHPGHIIYLGAAIVLLSVFLSGSRAGMAVATVIVVAWVTMEGLDIWRQRQQRERKTAWIYILLLILPLVPALWILLRHGLDPLGREIAMLDAVPDQLGFRGSAYAATWRMFMRAPLFGIGAGGFSCAFPYFQPRDLPGFFLYTHNDWLQYLSELGIVGVGILLATGLLFADSIAGSWGVRGRSRLLPTPLAGHLLRNPATRGIALALLGVALHAVVDFPLHIPPIALTVLLLIALLHAPKGERPGDGVPNRDTGHRIQGAG